MMTSGTIAALIGVLVLGFVEGLRRFYPARRTWLRMRRMHGRLAVRLLRERYERAAAHRAPRLLAMVLAVLVIAWVVGASWLDKRWYEVVLDVLPYVFVGLALVRTPGALGAIGGRMKEYEREQGEDPDKDLFDEGPGADEIAL
jgi:hypothetical protein